MPLEALPATLGLGGAKGQACRRQDLEGSGDDLTSDAVSFNDTDVKRPIRLTSDESARAVRNCSITSSPDVMKLLASMLLTMVWYWLRLLFITHPTAS